MNRADCLLLGSLFIAGMVVYKFPEMLKEAYPYFETIVLADHQKNEDKTSVKEVFNKLSDKCDIHKLKKIMESRDAIDSTIIKNCADVSSIQINSNLYNYESIAQVKHPFNEQTVDTLDGNFQIFQINNKTYPILKIRLKDLNTLEEFTANMDLSSDEESPFDNDQIDLIWETFKQQKQIRLKVIRSFCKGKQRSANIIEILP